MNKFVNLIVAITISVFLATNFYLLFGEKSVITKSLYVNEYERMTSKDYKIEMPKETLVAPLETYTVYIEDEDLVDLWLIAEGDSVIVGQELALLNTSRADGEREVWEAERAALQHQKEELEDLKSDLELLRASSQSTNYTNIDREDGITELEDRTTIALELQVGFTVDVTQEGAYSQAINSLDQQLSENARQIAVLDAQLAQDSTKPALISPVEGIVRNINRDGPTLSVDIYSIQKVLVTYLKDFEWEEIEQGQSVKIQGKGLAGIEEGTVLSVSTVHANESEMLTAYQQLDTKEAINPLAYYEMRIIPENELEEIPFSSNLNAQILIDEAFDAISIKEKWSTKREDQVVRMTILNAQGKPQNVEATAPFIQNGRVVITEGVESGDIVLYQPALDQFQYAPRIFLSFPTDKPTKEEWKAFGWRNYLKVMLHK